MEELELRESRVTPNPALNRTRRYGPCFTRPSVAAGRLTRLVRHEPPYRGRMSADAAAIYLPTAVVIGLGATLFIDLWALFLKRAFGTPSANYCLVGRWFRHMPEGRFMHANIANSTQKSFECAVGWIAHYVIGVIYGLVLV